MRALLPEQRRLQAEKDLVEALQSDVVKQVEASLPKEQVRANCAQMRADNEAIIREIEAEAQCR